MIHKRKFIKMLMLPLTIMIGIILSNCETKNEENSSQKQLSIANKKAKQDERKKWENSPDGINFNKWKNSPEGKKVQESYEKIKSSVEIFQKIEAMVISTTFQRENVKSSSPKWLIVKIDNYEYMMQFVPKDFEKLKILNVNDKIILKCRSASLSPNHPFLILSSDYIEKNNEILFKRDISKNKGC